MTTPFFDYKQAHDEMEADEKIRRLRAYLSEQQQNLIDLEAPYYERMDEAGGRIKELILAEEKTIVMHGVRGSYQHGRHSTSWKLIAAALNPPDELLGKYTKVGPPSVVVSVEE